MKILLLTLPILCLFLSACCAPHGQVNVGSGGVGGDISLGTGGGGGAGPGGGPGGGGPGGDR